MHWYFLKMLDQVRGRARNSFLRCPSLFVVELAACPERWKGSVDLCTFAVETRKLGTFSAVAHDHEMPVLSIRPGGSLLSNGYALLYHLTFDRPGKIQAPTYRPRRSEQFVSREIQCTQRENATLATASNTS